MKEVNAYALRRRESKRELAGPAFRKPEDPDDTERKTIDLEALPWKTPKNRKLPEE